MFINNDENKKPLPKHIGIIMDGNGRYAKQRNLPRIKGHSEGMENVKRITTYCSKLGIEYLTLYAFSTENWTRPKSEVNFLMRLPIDFLGHFLPELIRENVRVKTIGNVHELPKNTQKAVAEAIESTAHNTGLTLIFALNYGGRDEVVQAIKHIYKDVSAQKFSIEDVDMNVIDDYLMTREYPDPDMIVRTSGEYRLSNFLLWQSSYSELFFTDTLWPEFHEDELQEMIDDYRRRERRFGGLKKEG